MCRDVRSADRRGSNDIRVRTRLRDERRVRDESRDTRPSSPRNDRGSDAQLEAGPAIIKHVPWAGRTLTVAACTTALAAQGPARPWRVSLLGLPELGDEVVVVLKGIHDLPGALIVGAEVRAVVFDDVRELGFSSELRVDERLDRVDVEVSKNQGRFSCVLRQQGSISA